MFIRNLFCFLMIFSQFSIADTFPHSIVYRIDNRDISDITTSGGFHPRSDGQQDFNLTHHFTGQSVEGRRSIFISTSYLLRDVIEYSSRLVPYVNGQFSESYSTYIYAIRPDSNFYDVESSLETSRDNYDEETYMHDSIQRLLDRYNNMHEIVSVGHIPVARIMSYARLDGSMLNQYGLDDDSPLFSEMFWASRWSNNTNYNSNFDNDVSSTQPYQPTGVPSGVEVVAQLEPGSDTVRLANTCDGINLSNNTRIRQVNNECGNFHINRNIYDKTTFGKILLLLD